MRTSQYLLATLKETPAGTETISHQLLLRAGMIRQLGSGIYHWLPLGYRVLSKVMTIVREELDAIGCQEVLMPMVHPSDVWQESGRWDNFDPPLIKFKDRRNREQCLAPTHEEAMTAMIRDELHSYKQLPLCLYQIQTKFRDEPRPRAGILRAREFIMKDAYSFHSNSDDLNAYYDTMFAAYTRILTRLGLDFRAALADTGSIGGRCSHEFQVIAPSGEDKIAISDESDYVANIELAEAICQEKRQAPKKPMEKQYTPKTTNIDDVCKYLSLDTKHSLKTLVVKSTEANKLVAFLLRGDHELNPLKAEKHPLVATPLEMADATEITEHFACPIGFLGPVNAPQTIHFIADRSAAALSDFCCGANEVDQHYVNANWERDCPLPETMDIRFVQEGDPSPDGNGILHFTRGIEVGHIFQLGTKYSEKMQATLLNEQGKRIPAQMGCYGIGVSRIVAAAIEQHHDDKGIVWPESIAPFSIVIIPIQYHRNTEIKDFCDELYTKLKQDNHDVLLDDRNERPGVMFKDMELIGISHQVVVSEKLLEQGKVEYTPRDTGEKQLLSIDELIRAMIQSH